jgi:hypothetical protein
MGFSVEMSVLLASCIELTSVYVAVGDSSCSQAELQQLECGGDAPLC